MAYFSVQNSVRRIDINVGVKKIVYITINFMQNDVFSNIFSFLLIFYNNYFLIATKMCVCLHLYHSGQKRHQQFPNST